MLIDSSQQSVLELRDLSLKPASYVDVSAMRSHTQTGEVHVTKMGTGGARCALLCGHPPPSLPCCVVVTLTHVRAFQKPLKGYFLPSSNFFYCQISGLRGLSWGLGQGTYMLLPDINIHGHIHLTTVPSPILPRTPGSWAFFPDGPNYGMSGQRNIEGTSHKDPEKPTPPLLGRFWS